MSTNGGSGDGGGDGAVPDSGGGPGIGPGIGPGSDDDPLLGIVAAYRWEVTPLLRRTSGVEKLPRGWYRFRLRGEPAMLVVGGVGKRNAQSAAESLARTVSLKGLISLGFAGGLQESLQPGDVVVAEEVLDLRTGERFRCSEELLPETKAQRGVILAVDDVVQEADAKRRLGQQWSALAVDMESAGVARAATQSNLPFAAIRGITDGCDESLSIDFESCRSDDGGLSSLKILWQGMRSRNGVRDLWRLSKRLRCAAGSLAEALQAGC